MSKFLIKGNEEVREILERLGKVRSVSHHFVFAYTGRPLRSIKVSLAKALKRTKTSDFPLHDLRHIYYRRQEGRCGQNRDV